jgi:hypothetical protein
VFQYLEFYLLLINILGIKYLSFLSIRYNIFVFIYTLGTDHTRYISLSVFYRTLSNGEKYDRKWLLYSPSKGLIFCFVCKLFGSLRDNLFVSIGFDKWKKSNRIGEHENSIAHRDATTKWLLRTDTTRSINKEMCRLIYYLLKVLSLTMILATVKLFKILTQGWLDNNRL